MKTVKSAADNLLGIINDLLDFSKIEAGRLELDPADFSLRVAVGDDPARPGRAGPQEGAGAGLPACSPDVPDALVGDAGRLRQVLINLVGNAIKFTDGARWWCCVENAGELRRPEARGRPPLRGADTGIGIPPDKQEKIFRAFEQEDTSTTRKYGGTGLGLTIAARLVGALGGRSGRQRAGPGQHVRLHGPLRPTAASTGAGLGSAACLAPQPARAGGR